MTLLFVIKGSALNRGMNTGIENLAWGIASEGYNVHILSGGQIPECHDYELPSTVTYHFTGLSGRPQSFVYFYRQLTKEHTFDAVIGWVKNIGPLTHLYSRRLIGSRPLFIANQGAMTDSLEAGPIVKCVVRRLKNNTLRLLHKEINVRAAWRAIRNPRSFFHKVDRVVSITAVVKANVEDVYGIPENKCSVIHRGIDSELFAPPATKRARPGEYLKLLYTGNIIETKGVGDVVDAVAKLSTPIHFILCGNASQTYIQELERRLVSSGTTADHRIDWRGALGREELILEYQQADLFAFCSHGEGLGKSLLEAMSCGLPVIVSDIPPFKEIVVDHVNGLMVPVRSPSGIAVAIREYLEDSGLRERCGLSARETVVQRFSKQSEIDSWVRILDEHLVSHQ